MSEIADKISTIIKKRHSKAPQVAAMIEQWQGIEEVLDQLEVRAAILADTRSISPEVRDAVRGLNFSAERELIEHVKSTLGDVQKRFERHTVNLGVSGKARVGKSTLLQSISGLSEEQIPTGSGIPVTAVRSHIFHSDSDQSATLTFHTWYSFRDEVLKPSHDELNLALPQDLDSFRRFRYPALPPEEKTRLTGLQSRLEGIRESLHTFEKYLNRGQEGFNLDNLRPFVAYPTNDERKDPNHPRPYLAVRNAEIRCTFPQNEVKELGIIDLPGLGEIVASSDQHHVNGLKHEVDLVLLVKRPVEGQAYWGDEDTRAVDVLDAARGSIARRKDFMFVLVNSGVKDPITEALVDDIRLHANEGVEGKNFNVILANAMDPDDVKKKLLDTLLPHLAERLPQMDNEILEAARNDAEFCTKRIEERLRTLESTFAQITHTPSSVHSVVEDKAENLHDRLAGKIHDYLLEMERELQSNAGGSEYEKRLDETWQGIEAWIDSVFGGSEEKWCERAVNRMKRDQKPTPFLIEEMHAIRVEISNRFSALDLYFADFLEEMRSQVAGILRSELAIVPSNDTNGLRLFGESIREGEPCPTLEKAVNDLIGVRLEYRAQLHPHVRHSLGSIRVKDNKLEDSQIDTVTLDHSGAQILLQYLQGLATKASYDTYKALIAQEKVPFRVAVAAVDQFDDEFIRSRKSRREFNKLARSYRDEIWPGVFEGLDEQNARVKSFRESLKETTRRLAQIREN